MVVIAGNHDRHGLRIHFAQPPRGVHIVDGAERIVVGELALGCVAYQRDANQWIAAAAALARQGVDALVCHQSFHGARVPGYTFRQGVHDETVGAQGLPPGQRYILCGHIHPRQVTRLAGALIVHAGSTERTSFREGPTPKGYVLWQWGRDVRWRFVDLATRPRVVVRDESDLSQVMPGTLVWLERNAASELIRGVRHRGGWLVGPLPLPPPDDRQGDLFSAPQPASTR
jgi:DNA repair exonuclease SbcCD nuclease subunit